jgi:pimeloyl-ACP methyl ester carboxylesterase
MARTCVRQTSYEPFLDTTNTARDIDRIRQALGLPTISFYGLSYGTELGAVYAQLFPGHVGTMVLDGALDVNASLTQWAIEQAPALDASLRHLFTTCVAASCPIGPDPTSFYRSLTASMSARPLPAPGAGDDVPVTVGDLDTATLEALSFPFLTSEYFAALLSANQGGGGALRRMALSFFNDVNGAPTVDAYWAVTCNDALEHPGPDAAGRLARTLAADDPLLGAYAVNYNLGGCVAWPKFDRQQPVTHIHPSAAPPILVIGNTGDPNTPLVGAQHLAADLPTARLLIWDGWGHCWLPTAPNDGCMQQRVTTYLLGGGLPAAGTTCP